VEQRLCINLFQINTGMFCSLLREDFKRDITQAQEAKFLEIKT
jgi:hypothetical protein